MDRVRRCHILTPFQELSSKNLNSSSKVANWIIVDILINHWQAFLLEMVIAKDHYLSAIRTLRTQFQFEYSLSFKLMF